MGSVRFRSHILKEHNWTCWTCLVRQENVKRMESTRPKEIEAINYDFRKMLQRQHKKPKKSMLIRISCT